MKQKYPKFQQDYEDEYWRKLADKQQQKIKIAILLIALAIPLVAIFSDNIKQAAAGMLTAKKEIPFPSGTTQHYSEIRLAPFTVNSAENNCVVKLSEWNSDKPVVEIYVPKKGSASTKVKLGKFRTTIACGESWKGRKELFGRKTVITTGIKPLVFDSPSKNQYTGNILSLAQKIDGNFKTVNSMKGF